MILLFLFSIYSIASMLWILLTTKVTGIASYVIFTILVNVVAYASYYFFRKDAKSKILIICALTLNVIAANLLVSLKCDVMYDVLFDFMLRIIAFIVMLYGYETLIKKLSAKQIVGLMGSLSISLLLIARVFCNPVNGSYIKVFGVQYFGIVLVAYSLLVLGLEKSKNKKTLFNTVYSLDENTTIVLVYTVIIFLCCMLCNEYGLGLIIGLCSTVIFFIKSNSKIEKIIFSTITLSGTIFCLTKIGHIAKRFSYLFGMEKSIREYESIIPSFLFRNFYNSGWFGKGFFIDIETYKALPTDYPFVPIVIQQGMIYAMLVIVIFCVFFKTYFSITDRVESDSNRTFVFVSGTQIALLFLMNFSSSISSFICAGVPMPFVSQATAIQVCIVALLAITCAINREDANKLCKES